MGTSKIAAISGIYIILGLYSLGFNSADEATSKAANDVAANVQTEQIARTGISMALIRLGSSSSNVSFLPMTLSAMGGSVTYVANQPASLSSLETQITSTATLNNSTVTAIAIVHYDKGRWRIARVFTQTATL